MKNTTLLATTLAVGATGAFAGGIDRSGQSISALFEEGTYVELSFGSVMPSVTGTAAAAFGGTESGNVAPNYTTFGGAFKTDLNDKFSVALIFDQPFGANVSYDDNTYVLGGSAATVNSSAITILGQYHVNDNISVYAGPRIVSADGDYTAAQFGAVAYTSTYSSDRDTGYVVGAAYEIPDIALRAALTYSSQTEFAMDGTAGDLTATMPQSVNLDFQTGIAANTLLMASVRWADWSEGTIDDSLAGNLADFNDTDVYTYSVGLGRKFSDKFSGSIAVGYEKSTGDTASNLSPTDGSLSLSIGGAYSLGNGTKISGGVRYVALGDATTETVGSDFSGNSALAVGIKLSHSF